MIFLYIPLYKINFDSTIASHSICSIHKIMNRNLTLNFYIFRQVTRKHIAQSNSNAHEINIIKIQQFLSRIQPSQRPMRRVFPCSRYYAIPSSGKLEGSAFKRLEPHKRCFQRWCVVFIKCRKCPLSVPVPRTRKIQSFFLPGAPLIGDFSNFFPLLSLPELSSAALFSMKTRWRNNKHCL